MKVVQLAGTYMQSGSKEKSILLSEKFAFIALSYDETLYVVYRALRWDVWILTYGLYKVGDYLDKK